MELKGRKVITSDVTSEELKDFNVLAKVLNLAMAQHKQNKVEIDWLIDYKKGRQNILDKQKPVRDEINNKVVLNHAQMITRTIVGYFLGTPIQYIQNGDSDKKELIDELNRSVQYEDKASVDKELGEYQSIVGTAYRIIYKDYDGQEDEVPFEDRSLSPSNTFVVYENGIGEKPLLGGNYHDVHNEDNEFIGHRMYIYTGFGLVNILTDSDGVVRVEDIESFKPYDVGGVPIIEYPNNMWRLGDWELAIGLMDAINSLHSGRLDDIDQIVQSLLVFINAEIDMETYNEMRKGGIVSLKNISGSNTDIKNINNALDQSGMNLFSEELENLLYALIGIPNRNNRSGGGGDTGQAVELRDGWADLEIIARNKELTFKKAEKRTLKIILSMFNIGKTDTLSLKDIDIKFSRNKSNNMLVKTQSYQTLIASKTLDPADCLTIVDLVSDVNEYISRGKSFWGDDFAQIGGEKSDDGAENTNIDVNKKE